MFRFSLPLLVLLFAAGCADDAATDKGAEEQPLTNGKDDSFFRPTEHGAMQFGISNEATITDDAKFHSWNFTLTGDAEISLKTVVSANLDSVMYLYRRDSSTDTWGRYVEKNDDHDGNIWSQIDRAAGAGEYRVVVKGFKSALRGSFSVDATCEGAGCPTAQAGECTNGEFDSHPAATDFTSSCTSKILAVLGSDVLSQSSGSVPLMTHCSASGILQLAVSDYADYWQGFTSLDDVFYDGLDEAEVEYDYVQHADGHVVTVSAGGDEDGLTLIYNNDEQLLADYQHNQSPTVEFYCAEAGEAALDFPEPECFWDVWQQYPYDADPETNESGTDTLDVVEGLSFAGVGEAVADFRQHFGAGVDDHEVDYSVSEYTEAVQINLESVGFDASASYTYISSYTGGALVRESNESTIICQ